MTWDVTVPSNADEVSQGDDVIRELKEDIEAALTAEGSFPGADPDNPEFRWTPPVGNTASRPATPVEGQLYINTQRNAIERYNGSDWEDVNTVADVNQGYRRPNMTWISITSVDVEANTGTANETAIKFPDGSVRTVVEDTGSTHKYRRFIISATAEFTSGTEDSGLRSGLSPVDNTWYAIYAVKSAIDTDNFVLAGDTTMPTLANYGTLNSRYGLSGWVYLGMIRYGINAGTADAYSSNYESNIIKFVQKQQRTKFMPYSITVLGGVAGDIEGAMALTAPVEVTDAEDDKEIYTHVDGTGADEIPGHLSVVDLRLSMRTVAAAAADWGTLSIHGTTNEHCETSALGLLLVLDTIETADILGPGAPQDAVLLSYRNQRTENALQASVAMTFDDEQDIGWYIPNWPTSFGIAVKREAGNFPTSGGGLTANFVLALVGFEDSILAGSQNHAI